MKKRFVFPFVLLFVLFSLLPEGNGSGGPRTSGEDKTKTIVVFNKLQNRSLL